MSQKLVPKDAFEAIINLLKITIVIFGTKIREVGKLKWKIIYME